ncbi:DUF1571 domain-containing protein [Rhodopirellula halodulae]|uniref:DUF1571 domain-containing protein n=1 Tax=Rhodopirellula halodulae TaxID=2894198 RepID=UPI001E56743E|nr:DUF1571 domain-containing protein [Rhodopirellula sp. JC737]MCC9655706.1 DUF1571 domain-containing protein [Rhodopirellula sp. JC737]
MTSETPTTETDSLDSGSTRNPRTFGIAAVCFVLGIAVGWFLRGPGKPNTTAVAPTSIGSVANSGGEASSNAENESQEVAMAEVLKLAEGSLQHLIEHVDGYTTRMIKHEQDRSGVLQEPSEMFMKIQTRHVGGETGQGLRAYLRFETPESAKGREVIWIEDQNDGQMLVREAGFIGSMMTAKLDPTNFLAMRGQRYPITEIGLTNLVEKLIERGSRDIDNPDVRVIRTPRHKFDGKPLTLLQIQRASPSDQPDDFSLAEVVIDEERQLIVSFRSFGWPETEGDAPPLIESYEYHDLVLNPKLTDLDFDPANPEYTFPE